jgi:hypothetical protein
MVIHILNKISTIYNQMKKKVIVFLLLLIGIFFYAKKSYVPMFNGIDISHHNTINWETIKKMKL